MKVFRIGVQTMFHRIAICLTATVLIALIGATSATASDPMRCGSLAQAAA